MIKFSEEPVAIPVLLFNNISEGDLNQFFLNSQPVIIRGANFIENVMEWSLDNLLQKIPNVEFPLSYRDENTHVIGAESNTKMKLHEFIEKCNEIALLSKPIRYYLSGSNLLENDEQNGNEELNQLRNNCSKFKQFIEEKLSKTKQLSSLGFWIGLDKQKTHLHFDCVNNLMLQIRGKKTFLLISPSDHLKVNLHSYKSAMGQEMNGEIYRFSQYDIFKTDIPKVQVFKGSIQRGDIILIPLGWFHAVYSEGEESSCGSFNIALNAFWNATETEWNTWKHLKLFKNNY
ncbi:hypothetical protein ABK040_001004 [Willaertia magna]